MMKWVAPRAARPQRGALFTIAALLIGSAVLRIGLTASEAIALEKSHTPSEVKSSSDTACETVGDLDGMLVAFREREERIATQELKLQKRMQALAVADQKIDEKLAALTKAEADLRATLALADSAAETDLTQLTTVYENMKPKDAAALFEQMAPEFSAGFLGRIKPASAASIMAGLSAERAYSISVILAGRNANVPKE